MLIEGKWHELGSAAHSPAVLRLEKEHYKLDVVDGSSYSGKLESIQISDRLGNVERKLTFEDGSIFATSDNDAVDKIFKDHNKVNSFIHAFESRFGWVVVALILTICFTFSFFKWGVPWTSAKIAHALPQKTNELVAIQTLDFLDKFIFEESKLNLEKTEQIREHFKSRLIPLENNTAIKYKLHFREWSDGEQGIANALALPSGDIILTDEFVKLSKNQDEIDSVLLHEMGHVVHRHTLEMIIESTLVTTVVMLVTGDNSGLADMGTGLGSLLVSTNYSRNHETEADLYAFEHMLVAKIDPKVFSDIMSRITNSMEGEDINEEGNSFINYLSTHPSTSERVEQAKRYSKCFQAGLVICDAAILNSEL